MTLYLNSAIWQIRVVDNYFKNESRSYGIQICTEYQNKPKIKQVGDMWMCYGKGRMAMKSSATSAYLTWKGMK